MIEGDDSHMLPRVTVLKIIECIASGSDKYIEMLIHHNIIETLYLLFYNEDLETKVLVLR